MITACILDSGSSISLLKISLLPREAQLHEVKEHYFGIKIRPLHIYGKILCFVLKGKIKYYLNLTVVANEYMIHDVVLDRNFIEACDLNLDFRTLKMITVEDISKHNPTSATRDYCQGDGRCSGKAN